MKKHLSIELLDKYINGNCSASEEALVKKWYKSFEHDAGYTPNLNLSDQKALEEKIYNRILHNIDIPNDQLVTPYNGITRKLQIRYWISGMAALLLLAVTLSVYTRITAGKMRANSGGQQIVSITNNTNRIYRAILPDRSMVWLNPHSQLKYPKVFAAASREVSMLGECFFEVTKNPKRPFIIRSRAMITKVWGTSFRIRDNAQSREADVSVITGKVSVSVKTNQPVNTALNIAKGEVMLYPHQKVVYSTNDHLLKPAGVTEESDLKIWHRVNLSFDNQLLKNIIPVLNNRFDVHIVVTNEKLNQYMLSADFSGFNLPELLEALNKSLSVNYELKNNTIELK